MQGSGSWEPKRLCRPCTNRESQLSVRLKLLVDARAVPPSAFRFLREKAGPNRKPKYACMLAGVIGSKNEREMRDVHEFPAIFAY